MWHGQHTQYDQNQNCSFDWASLQRRRRDAQYKTSYFQYFVEIVVFNKNSNTTIKRKNDQYDKIECILSQCMWIIYIETLAMDWTPFLHSRQIDCVSLANLHIWKCVYQFPYKSNDLCAFVFVSMLDRSYVILSRINISLNNLYQYNSF